MSRHFKHPSADRLHAVIRRAERMGCWPRLLHDLEDVTRKCDVCQRAAGPFGRFRSFLPIGDAVLYGTVCLDLMELGSRSALHAVDKATKLSAARFLRSESAACVWAMFD